MNNSRSVRKFHYGVSLFALLFPILLFGAIWGDQFQLQRAVAAPQQQTLPIVSFPSSQLNVQEADGIVNAEVILNTTVAFEVRVNYATLSGTASGGSDYSNTSGTLIFPANTLTQTVPLSIINDSVFEGTTDEFFYLRLSEPVSATLGTNSVLQVFIDDNETAPTATPNATPSIFVDAYEPNNSLGTAFTIAAGAAKSCNVTLWPTGDEDYFRFVGKAGSTYQVATSDLTPGLDTVMTVYNTNGNVIATNDDAPGLGNRSSLVTFTASQDGFYYARIINRDPSDPSNKTYCIQVTIVANPTPTPSQTPVPGADVCEYNSTRATACVLEIGEDNGFTGMSFVPTLGSLQDTDYYKVWMRLGTFYTCDTYVNNYADTNMIFLDANGNDFQPNLGNNDKAPGDYGSKLSIIAPYTGWLYIMIGPIVPPPYEESNLHQYDIECLATVSTPTPTPSPTSAFVAPPSTGGGQPTATPLVVPTFLPTPTPIDFSFLTPQATATPPVVQIQPLPTSTPVGGGQQNIAVNVTVYYDSNFNFLPELNEGVQELAVALYDNATGGLLAFGSTNEAGTVSFTSIATAGAVRVSVPFLGYNQVVVGGSATILVRIAPQPLPIGIP